MSIVDQTALYSQEQLQLLFGELHEKEAQINHLWEKCEDLEKSLERAKDSSISQIDELREEARKLRERDATVRAICAIPHETYGAYSKLILITHAYQVPYSAGKHEGNPDEMITSMNQWGLSIGGAINSIAKNIKPCIDNGTLTRTRIECPDGFDHFAIEINQEHLRNPKLIQPVKERPNNGGSKICPNCGGYCLNRKRVINVYECKTCGIDFDAVMSPIDHSSIPEPDNTPTIHASKPEPARPEPDYVPERDYVDDSYFAETLLTKAQIDALDPKSMKHRWTR